MPTDIVFPHKNEAAFLTIAKKLGYSKIIFCYKGESPKSFPKSSIQIRTASLNPHNKADYLLSKDFSKLRAHIEHSKINIFFEIEEQQKKDFMHQRGSGLNHVLCKLMAKKNKTYAFSLSQVLHASKSQKAKILGRIRQNQMLCKKYKVKTMIASFARIPLEMRSPHDIKIFFNTL